MEKVVCTNVCEINPQNILNQISSIEDDIRMHRKLSSLTSLETEILAPYKEAKKKAEFELRIESLKKKSDRKDIIVPKVPMIDPCIKEDLRAIALGKEKEEILRKYIGKSLLKTNKTMLVKGLHRIREIGLKKINLEERVSRARIQSSNEYLVEVPIQMEQFVLPGDIVQIGKEEHRIQSVSFQGIEGGSWKVDFLDNRTYRSFHQKYSGGKILRETKSELHNLDELLDSLLVNKTYSSCQIQYVNTSCPKRQYNRMVYPIQSISYPVNTSQKGWKYMLNNLWEEYREQMSLQSMCVVAIHFGTDREDA